jgi:hypothetical protein
MFLVLDILPILYYYGYMRKLWTEEENDLIISMKTQGFTYPEMVPHLPDRNLRTIAVQANKLCPSKGHVPWSIEEEELLLKLKEEGLPYKEISAIIGRSYSAVKTKGSYLLSGTQSKRDKLEYDFIETGQEYFKF